MPSLLELEVRLNDFELWKPSEDEGEVAQKMIDWLDQALAFVEPKNSLYSKSIRSLQALCRRSARLPASCRLSANIMLLSSHSISSSALSDVYRGRMAGKHVAVKVLRVHADNRVQVAKAFHNEAVMWKLLNHHNLVPFLGTSAMFPVCLISLWMAHGTVSSYLKEYPHQDRLKFARDIVNGLRYMHSLDIVHGDLKSANVLVDEDCNARLSDFGVSTLMHHTAAFTGSCIVEGTLRWMAPELLSCDSNIENSGCPTKASDLYSLAMVFYEMFSGCIPFDDIRKDYSVVGAVLGGRRPQRPTGRTAVGLRDTLWLTMQKCWSADPRTRPELSEVATMVTPRSNSTDLPANVVISFFVPWRGTQRIPPVAPVAPQTPPCTTVSQDGRHVAVVLRGGLVQICTLSRAGATFYRFPTFSSPRAINCIRFSANGRYLLTSYDLLAGPSTCMRVWHCQGKTWTAVGRTFKTTFLALPAVYTSGKDARILVLVSHLGQGSSLRPYDAASGKSTSLAAVGPTTSREDGKDLALVISPDEALAAAGSALEIVIYRLKSLNALRSLTLGSLPIFCNLPTIDPRTLALCDDSVNFIFDDASLGRHWTCNWPLDGSCVQAEELERMPPHHGASFARSGAALALRRCASVLVYDAISGVQAGPPLVQDQSAFWMPAAGFVGASGKWVVHASARSAALSVWEVETGRRVCEVEVGGRVEVDEILAQECFGEVEREGKICIQ